MPRPIQRFEHAGLTRELMSAVKRLKPICLLTKLSKIMTEKLMLPQNNLVKTKFNRTILIFVNKNK